MRVVLDGAGAEPPCRARRARRALSRSITFVGPVFGRCRVRQRGPREKRNSGRNADAIATAMRAGANGSMNRRWDDLLADGSLPPGCSPVFLPSPDYRARYGPKTGIVHPCRRAVWRLVRLTCRRPSALHCLLYRAGCRTSAEWEPISRASRSSGRSSAGSRLPRSRRGSPRTPRRYRRPASPSWPARARRSVA